MLPSSDLETDGNAEQPIPASSNGENSERRSRRRRLQLSCGECRNKKLSCDRQLPCQRCIRSGRPEQCSFEAGIGQLPVSNNQVIQQQAQRNTDEIRDLRAEVAQLRESIPKTCLQHERNSIIDTLPVSNHAELDQAVLLREKAEEDQSTADVVSTELSDPRERSPRGYYNKHNLLQFFEEVPQLFPFIKETADEWLKPLGVHLKKDKFVRNGWKTNTDSQEESPLEGLLPPKDDTDTLVSFYLDHLERLHRVVHIPTFKKEYANFWVPGRTCHTAMTALILSMISISTCVSPGFGDSTTIPSAYRNMPVQWIYACDEWLRQQSSKHCKLMHYQISCLLYLAKRTNIIRKKRFWKETGCLIQNAIIDGMHREPASNTDSPYMREMKRRIWAVLRELDLQNAFEYGLPTLLHNIDSNIAAPANLDDDDFDEASNVLPTSTPLDQYTSTSYQTHSSRSWTLRLEILRHLFSTGLSKPLSYEDVLRYTHEITLATNSLLPWDMDEAKCEYSSKFPMLTYAFLHFQLKECILAIHRPYLQRENSKFWLSENVCHQLSRDILLMNTKLAQLGIQTLTLLREDLLLASLNLTRITMLQPKGSTSIIRTCSESSIKLLEQCLPFVENRYLRCFYGEPWCFLTMCAAIMLLKIHVGKETWQTAKSSCARKFLDLHYKHIGRHETFLLSQQHLRSQDSVNQIDTLATCPQQTSRDETIFAASGWPDNIHHADGINAFDLDMDLDNLWEAWGSGWPK